MLWAIENVVKIRKSDSAEIANKELILKVVDTESILFASQYKATLEVKTDSAPDRLTITSARLFPIEFHESRRFFLVASWFFNARL